MAPSKTAAIGTCSTIRPMPQSPASIRPRTSRARISCTSPAPRAWAVKAIALMRRKANSQNRQSNMTDEIATPPSRAGSRSRPIAMVETIPISGVVRFAIIAGPAMANTRRWVTGNSGDNEQIRARPADLPAARPAEQSRQQPDRDYDHGAEQEVAPQPVDGIEAEVPDPLDQQTDAVDDIPGIEADRRKHHADQDR